MTDEPSRVEQPSIGQRLFAAREAMQLTREQVAEELRLSVRTITCLEEDSYEGLAAPAYIRGYLNSYARLLNQPVDEILTAFSQLGLSWPRLEQQPTYLEGRESRKRPPWVRYVGVGLALLLAILVFAWLHQSNKAVPAAVAQAPAPQAIPVRPIAPVQAVQNDSDAPPVQAQAIQNNSADRG